MEHKKNSFWFRFRLKKLREKSILGNPLFQEYASSKKWERFEYDKVENLGIVGFAFRSYPYPSTQQLIDIAIISNSNEKSKVAAALLFRLESIGIEFREKLIHQLEQNSTKLEYEKFMVIYKAANLFNTGNLKDPFEKLNSEVSKDFRHYQDLYQRTEILKKRLSPDN